LAGVGFKLKAVSFDAAYPMSTVRIGLNALARAPCEPGDERCGEWTREQREKMNARFTERLERAFRSGRERRESAAGSVFKRTLGSMPFRTLAARRRASRYADSVTYLVDPW
jgi:hypothetical protein